MRGCFWSLKLLHMVFSNVPSALSSLSQCLLAIDASIYVAIGKRICTEKRVCLGLARTRQGSVGRTTLPEDPMYNTTINLRFYGLIV